MWTNQLRSSEEKNKDNSINAAVGWVELVTFPRRLSQLQSINLASAPGGVQVFQFADARMDGNPADQNQSTGNNR